ncbi:MULTISPECIES: restriction endonuclease subunit S [Acidithiobacillales]|jgi:type I restriction enzyme S subunit|uniref:restriction endonuclease subunit S n=1 Tax=Acidithiobacillales TaxID=225057 RepID=UPI000687339A|nr:MULTISPECIES: restriction endonuclease subunit S [Acidithiobacillales]MBU2763954.1 restriction endonuclease subunit S [Acidithiobacillus caldus]MBU2770531.1 restriction endonuclease subunit S [Acidithiobacillus caldus]
MNGTETGSATLAELCDLISEQVHPADVPEALYVGLEHVTPGRLRRSGGGIAADVQSHKYAFRRNDILYGKLRPYLDKAILADTDGVCTTELLVLRAKPGVDPRFLACLVHDPDFVEHALTGVTGAHHPRTSWAHIAQFERPRFSFEEQRTIAGLLWRTQDLLRVCEDTIEAAQKLKLVAMRELFTRGLRGEPQRETEFGPVPDSWVSSPLDECAEVQTGAAKGRRFSDGETVEVPYLRVANVQDGHLDLSEMKKIKIRRSEIDRYRLKPGDVVLTEGGDFDKLGRGFIWRGELDLCVHQNHVFAVRTDRGRLLPDFFAYLAQSAYGKAYFLKVAHKTTNLACINSTKLKAFPAVFPPTLDEQREIVAVLDAIDRKIDLHRKKRAVLEELFKALLHKLMTGEIRVDELDLSVLDRVESEAEEVVA